MEIVYDETSLRSYVDRATDASPEHPILVDRFLDDAVEVDVDALFDGEQLYLAGVMEHIEEAGIHSGDSACALPPITLGRGDIARIREATEGIARGVGVRGLLNVQYALQADVLYVIEANPRASRTVPFVAKATGVPLAKAASRVMLGATIAELRAEGLLPAGDGAEMPMRSHVAVKEAVLPFNRFIGVDTVLGPEMKSTGEVMGIDAGFGVAYAKSQAAAYGTLPTKGRVFVSVANRDKRAMVFPVKRLVDLGFEVLATEGTAEMLDRNGVRATVVPKYSEGLPGNAVERILAGEIDLVINTPFSTSGNSGPRVDGYEIRSACVAPRGPVRDDGAGRGRRRCRGSRRCCAATSTSGRCRNGTGCRARPGPRRRSRDGEPVHRSQRLMPTQVRTASVLQIEKLGAYHRIAWSRPPSPRRCGPATSSPSRSAAPPAGSCCAGRSPSTASGSRRRRRDRRRHLLRRRRGHPLAGRAAGRGPGRRRRPAGAALPAARCEPARCVLVGGGYGAAPLFLLAAALRKRDCRVDMVLGAATEDRLFGALDAKRVSDTAAITTDDGSVGVRGRVTDALDPFLTRRRRLRLRADADARRGHPQRPALRDPDARRGRGGDGLRHRRLHDLRAAGARPGRGAAHGRAPASRAPSSPATPCCSTTSAPSRREPSDDSDHRTAPVPGARHRRRHVA